MWYTRKDKTIVYKKGRYKVLEIFKRPHGKYCCAVFYMGNSVACEGYFGTFLKTISSAKKWGIATAKELKII